jgi:outer membrane autotransporter protein
LALFALSRDGYSETGGTAALSADADTSGLGLVTLGIRASNLLASSGDAPSLKGEIAWQHAVGDLDGSLSQSFAGGDAFTVAGAPIAADTLALQLALEQPVGTRMAVGIVYDGAFADRLTRHSLSGRLEAKF